MMINQVPNPKNSVRVFLYSYEEGVITISLTVKIDYKKLYKID